MLFRDSEAAADKKLKPANSVKVRHILCEKQSKVCSTLSPELRLTVDLHKAYTTFSVATCARKARQA